MKSVQRYRQNPERIGFLFRFDPFFSPSLGPGRSWPSQKEVKLRPWLHQHLVIAITAYYQLLNSDSSMKNGVR